MSNSAQQLDKGALRSMLTQGEKKEAKKQQTRKKRREAKDINKDNPKHNRYPGGWAV